METSLHRQLKEHFAGGEAETEVKLGRFRIDVVRGKELIEIQHGSLAAIRDKVRKLCEDDHRVRVVKPIIRTKRLVKRKKKGGRVVDQRLSPKRGGLLDVFDELVYFTRAFPHKRLTVEATLVDIEEWRVPGHGKRRRRRANDFVVEDQHLLEVGQSIVLRRAGDLASLLPSAPPKTFHTGHLADVLGVQRWVAQRVAYCFREMGAAKCVGKQGNARLYQLTAAARKKVGQQSAAGKAA